MPAVDYRMPDGLNWHELSTILGRAIGSGRALGIDITIFNPKLDETGVIARNFVDALAEGLSAVSSSPPPQAETSRARPTDAVVR